MKSLMEEFAHNNTGLAVKNRTTKAVVAQFVSNCGSKSDRLASFVIHVSFFLLELSAVARFSKQCKTPLA